MDVEEKNKVKSVPLEDDVNKELDRLGQRGRWVWYGISISFYVILDYIIINC